MNQLWTLKTPTELSQKHFTPNSFCVIQPTFLAPKKPGGGVSRYIVLTSAELTLVKKWNLDGWPNPYLYPTSPVNQLKRWNWLCSQGSLATEIYQEYPSKTFRWPVTVYPSLSATVRNYVEVIDQQGDYVRIGGLPILPTYDGITPESHPEWFWRLSWLDSFDTVHDAPRGGCMYAVFFDFMYRKMQAGETSRQLWIEKRNLFQQIA